MGAEYHPEGQRWFPAGGLTQDGTHVHSLPTRRDAAESPVNRVARCQRFCEVVPTAFIFIRTR